MRKRKNDLIQLGILLVLGLLVILSLVLPQLGQPHTRPPLKSLSVLTRDSDNALGANARLGMEQAADELGAELRFLTLSSQNNALEQEMLFCRELEGGADGIILSPVQPEALSDALSDCPRPCPVITMESAMEGACGLIAPDDALLGQQLAQTLLEDWTGGTVLLLDTSQQCTAVSRRLQAALETLQSAQVPAIVKEVSAPIAALSLPELLSQSESSWVMVFEPAATTAVVQGVQHLAAPPALYGVGSSAAITSALESGVLTAVAAWSDYAAGYLAVEQLLSAIQGNDISSVPLAFVILRGEDIYEPNNQKLLFPVIS